MRTPTHAAQAAANLSDPALLAIYLCALMQMLTRRDNPISGTPPLSTCKLTFLCRLAAGITEHRQPQHRNG
jgi:hypothetical protein